MTRADFAPTYTTVFGNIDDETGQIGITVNNHTGVLGIVHKSRVSGDRRYESPFAQSISSTGERSFVYPLAVEGARVFEKGAPQQIDYVGFAHAVDVRLDAIVARLRHGRATGEFNIDHLDEMLTFAEAIAHGEFPLGPRNIPAGRIVTLEGINGATYQYGRFPASDTKYELGVGSAFGEKRLPYIELKIKDNNDTVQSRYRVWSDGNDIYVKADSGHNTPVRFSGKWNTDFSGDNASHSLAEHELVSSVVAKEIKEIKRIFLIPGYSPTDPTETFRKPDLSKGPWPGFLSDAFGIDLLKVRANPQFNPGRTR